MLIDASRAMAADAYWRPALEFDAEIDQDNQIVASRVLPTAARKMLELTLDRHVLILLAADEPVPAVPWVVQPRDLPIPDGFTTHRASGRLLLLRKQSASSAAVSATPVDPHADALRAASVSQDSSVPAIR